MSYDSFTITQSSVYPLYSVELHQTWVSFIVSFPVMTRYIPPSRILTGITLTGTPCFSLYCALQIIAYFFFFLQIDGLWRSCFNLIYRHHFSNNICSLCVSLSHFGNSWNIINFFVVISLVRVICDG